MQYPKPFVLEIVGRQIIKVSIAALSGIFCPLHEQNIIYHFYSDPLRDHPDVHPEPVFGPSIQFAGKAARWTGDGHSFEGQVGCEARITMEAYAGHRTTAYLEIINDGTTSIYYDWKVWLINFIFLLKIKAKYV